jgi:Flp pilus assembly protein TadB
MPNEPDMHEAAEVAAVSEWLASLASLRNAPALPDPDWLWARAQISAREEASARALRRSMLRYIALSAGAACLLFAVLKTVQPGLEVWAVALAEMAADPVVNVAISALAASASALVTGGLVLGRSFVASRLRDLGLL